MSVAVIVPAAGRSTRMGRDKLWIEAGGRPLLGHTLAAVAAADMFDVVVVATDPSRWAAVRLLAASAGVSEDSLRLVAGGERRQDSVAAGLTACGTATLVVVHDGARPFATPALFAAAVGAARRHGAATTAVPLLDTIKRIDRHGRVLATLDRSELVAVQTPQAFSAALLRRAHAEARRTGRTADDDCALVEALGEPVVTVSGDPLNLKVTRPADLASLELALRNAGENRP